MYFVGSTTYLSTFNEIYMINHFEDNNKIRIDWENHGDENGQSLSKMENHSLPPMVHESIFKNKITSTTILITGCIILFNLIKHLENRERLIDEYTIVFIIIVLILLWNWENIYSATIPSDSCNRDRCKELGITDSGRLSTRGQQAW